MLMYLFQTVVNLYLLEGIPLISKHTVVLYLLFDLMHLEEDSSELVSVLPLHYAKTCQKTFVGVILKEGLAHFSTARILSNVVYSISTMIKLIYVHLV